MIHLTPAGVTHTDILDSCRSHTLRYLTPAGVIHTDILDSCRSHPFRYLTPAVIHVDSSLLQVSYMEIPNSCRSHSY